MTIASVATTTLS
ncbi:hypothetical protein D043_0585A, partial [Vibrio parahaemolyticus EKP-021]